MGKRNSKTTNRNNQNGRGNRPNAGRSNRGGNHSNVESDKREDPRKSGNDPAWYGADPVLLKDAASFPFSYPTGGTRLRDTSLYVNRDTDDTMLDSVAGVMSEVVFPSVGTSLEPNSPVNVAAKSVYSFVRHANSGHSNYDAPDLMLYILAMSFMYQFLVWCQRLYGYVLTYDQRNRYIGDVLISENGVNPASVRAEIANFRFWINQLISKIASFAVPATMSIFSRMSFMYSDYYIEGTSIREQLYQYVPSGFYQFNIDSSTGKGQLLFKTMGSKKSGTSLANPLSITDVMSWGNTLFDAIWSQEDFGIMSGDILKAYGDNIIKLSQIPEMYTIAPKFDAMVLTQMKNARVTRIGKKDYLAIGDPDLPNINQSDDGMILQTLSPTGYASGDVDPVTGYTLTANNYQLVNNAMTSLLKDYSILSVDTDNPTPEVVMEASRLMVAYDNTKSWYVGGTDVIIQVRYKFTTEWATNGDARYLGVARHEPFIVLPQLTATAASLPSFYAGINALNQLLAVSRMFHYAPRIDVVNLLPAGGKWTTQMFFDLDNFTLLDYTDLEKLHSAAVINMFAVPSVGKIIQ